MNATTRGGAGIRHVYGGTHRYETGQPLENRDSARECFKGITSAEHFLSQGERRIGAPGKPLSALPVQVQEGDLPGIQFHTTRQGAGFKKEVRSHTQGTLSHHRGAFQREGGALPPCYSARWTFLSGSGFPGPRQGADYNIRCRPMSSVRYITVREDHHGQRLDNFLSRELKGAPKSLIYRIVRSGEVRVNQGRAKPDTRLSAGDEIRLPPLRLAERGEAPVAGSSLKARLESSILYEDAGLLVINKPAGLAVHGGSGQSLGLIEALRQLRPQEKALELVHRLDRETSGCLLVAKKRSALRYLQAALREHRVQKTYVALVKGPWPKRKRVVESKLEKFELASGERRVKASEEGKASRTEFTVLGHYLAGPQPCTLVEAMPVTGRTHQIRVHARSVGCPLACDNKYADDEFNALMKKHGFRRLFLHAAELSFPLPPREEGAEPKLMTVKADLPEDLAKPLGKLKKGSE